ncbi:MAG: hypothetical protein GY953_36610 [bacterium]|nr:hypothetical protein [bacterium]
MPEVIELRVRICTVAGKWEMGVEMSKALLECFAPADSHRIAAAEFCHAHARHFCAIGDIHEAKAAINWAAELWPPIRGEMNVDRALEAVW